MDLMDIIEQKEMTLDERIERAEKGDVADLDSLVYDEDYRVREIVANHGHHRHLKILVDDPSDYVRGEVAANGGKSIQDKLKNDKSPHVIEALRRYGKK